MPHIFAGYRIAAAFAGMGAVAGEWAGAQAGLGVFMQESRRYFDIPAMLSALAALVLLSLAFYLTVLGVEKWWSLKRFS